VLAHEDQPSGDGLPGASLRDVQHLLLIYGVSDEAQADEPMRLARGACEAGWWTQYEEPLFSPLLVLEQEAV